MAHSRFGGSVAKRFLKCPGSIRLALEAPPQPGESPYAAEGTLLHDIAAAVIASWLRGTPMPEHVLRSLEDLDQEQRDVIATYNRVVREEFTALNRDGKARAIIEEKVSMPGLHGEFFGYVDAGIVSDTALRTIDLKCGRGVNVEADDPEFGFNPQAGYYTLGMLHALGAWVVEDEIVLPASLAGLTDIEMIIVQPRRGGVKRKSVTLSELAAFAGKLARAAREADTDTPRFASGDWCRFCPARAICPHIQDEILKAAQDDFADPDGLHNAALSDAMSVVPLAEAWCKDVRRVAAERVRDGGHIRGFKARVTAGTPAWAKDKDLEMIMQMINQVGITPVDTKLKTPAVVLREAKKLKIEPSIFADLIERGPPRIALVPDHDGEGADPADDFDEIG